MEESMNEVTKPDVVYVPGFLGREEADALLERRTDER